MQRQTHGDQQIDNARTCKIKEELICNQFYVTFFFTLFIYRCLVWINFVLNILGEILSKQNKVKLRN